MYKEDHSKILSFKDRLKSSSHSPLSLQTSILCDTSSVYPSPFVPKPLRSAIFSDLHNLSHHMVTPSIHLVKSRYFWWGIDKYIRSWSCQISKTHQDNRSPELPFEITFGRFESVQIDIVGPLPPTIPLSPHAFFHCSYSLVVSIISLI